MDDYPEEYLVKSLPLIVLSGLCPDARDCQEHPLQRNGFKVTSDSPLVQGEGAQRLLQRFQAFQADGDIFARQNETDQPSDLMPYRLKACGRQYLLPCRKASPQATPPENQPDHSFSNVVTSHALHSPLSPLSPGSHLYPDGLMTTQWLAKHQQIVPCYLISFFLLESNPNTSTLRDNQLRTEISGIRASLETSKYRTKFAVVLLSEKSIQDDPELLERVNNIRKAVGSSTAKEWLYFVSLRVSGSDLTAFVVSLLSSIRPNVIDYYDELKKRARRKRERIRAPNSTPPSTPGIAQQLTRAGWDARYNFKMAVFEEFKAQEFDRAAGLYAGSLEFMFDRTGVFEHTSSWSPRWMEARLFTDLIFLRLTHCLLLSRLYTSAVRSHENYHTRVEELLERKGKGTSQYGFKAWEARQAEIVAALLRANTPPVTSTDNVPVAYFTPEKLTNPEDIPLPWERLHIAPYWYMLAARLTIQRRFLATSIPEEDRTAPSQSPAGRVAQRQETYDTYLVPEPDVETQDLQKGGAVHQPKITDLLRSAVETLNEDQHSRMISFAKFVTSREYAGSEDFKSSAAALEDVWRNNKWRKAKWWKLVGATGSALHESCLQTQRHELRIATLWELHHSDFPLYDSVDYDFMKALDSNGIKGSQVPKVVVIDHDEVHSPIVPSIVFEASETFAGGDLSFQLQLRSYSRSEAAALSLNQVTVSFEGPLEEVCIKSQGELPTSTRTPDNGYQVISLSRGQKGAKSVQGMADLLIGPGETKVLHCHATLKESGTLIAKFCGLEISGAAYGIQYSQTMIRPSSLVSSIWYSSEKDAPLHAQHTRSKATSVKILPKPPKIDVNLEDLEELLYTGERAKFTIQVVNNEEEDAIVEIEMLLLGAEPTAIAWVDDTRTTGSRVLKDDQPIALSAALGKLTSGDKADKLASINLPLEPRELVLEIKVKYRLVSDPDTVVTKTQSLDVNVIRPIEANYSLAAEYHDTIWPNYFTMASENSVLPGLAYRWRLLAKIVSFAEESISIVSANLRIINATNAVCEVVEQTPATRNDDGILLALEPKAHTDLSFTLDATKHDLDDRRATGMDAAIEIHWRRTRHGEPATGFRTDLAIPHLTLASNEPRLLAHVGDDGNDEDGVLTLHYTIENPSTHFLTFSTNMEPNESIIFSGPQNTSFNLTPLSRHTINYRIASLDPVENPELSLKLNVVDSYFQKALKAIPTGSLRANAEGHILISSKS